MPHAYAVAYEVEGLVPPPLFKYVAEGKVHGGNYLEKTYMYIYVCTHLPFVSIWSLCSVKKYDLCTKCRMEPPFVETSSYASDM